MVTSSAVVKVFDHVPGFVAQRLHTNMLATRLLRPLINAVIPEREMVISVRSGLGAGLRVPILPQSEKYYWTGAHERHVQDTLADVLRPGMTFWDIGAHIGFFSMLASRFVTSSGRVDAFEPFPPNQIRFAKSLKLNQLENVCVHPIALGSRSGITQFHINDSSLMGSLVPQGDVAPLPVQCLSADDAARTLEPPDVMKIDVEGAELDVLQGAGRLLLSVRPTVLIELTSIDMLVEARNLMPTYQCRHIGANHWLLTPR
jgi:FkbM family methyltransferase